MPSIDLVVETALSRSPRVRQLEALFDVPATEKCRLAWRGDLPIDGDDWRVGLIVGPSGSGKTTILRGVFGGMPALDWRGASVVDDFAEHLSMDDIAGVCQAVGFNTIPAWMRPYAVLSNGERFRVDLARRMVEADSLIVMDEFTSVVDRQVAQIGAHAVQKYVRRHGRQFVAASCHYDIIEWLQPDWTFEPATMTYTRRSVQRRPALDITIARVDYPAWRLFAPFHYLTADLHRAAACFVLFVGDRPASFGGMLHRPHPRARDIIGLSRLVTLPDWQGLGLAMILSDTLGSAYKALGKRMHTYPAHPSLMRSFGNSERWAMTQRPASMLAIRDGNIRRGSSTGVGATRVGGSGNMAPVRDAGPRAWQQGRRPCAVFEYRGPAMDADDARRLLGA